MAALRLSSLWSTNAAAPSLQEAQQPTATPQGDAAGCTRTGTRAALFEAVAPTHKLLNDHTFFAALKSGSLSRTQLAGYLVNQSHVLGALEVSLLALGQEPSLQPMLQHPNVVARRAALAAQDASDLGLECLPNVSPAACRLAARIGQLGRKTSPHYSLAAFAVHVWTQYNAMLNGGQQTARKMSTLYPELRMAMLQFDPPAREVALAFSQSINEIEHAGTSLDALCAEAQRAFSENAAMLDDIMARRSGSIAQLFDDLCTGSSWHLGWHQPQL